MLFRRVPLQRSCRLLTARARPSLRGYYSLSTRTQNPIPTGKLCASPGHQIMQASTTSESSQASKLPNTNKLVHAKSPYLIQHAQDPVDWREWNDETFQLAKQNGKPIFLSVGYSACHWCHVMQHEVFQNADVAKIMNDNFVNIKVDREERPDVDRVYMTFHSLANQGRGGWPLSIFLTPSLEPIVSATYVPPPNFIRLMDTISSYWTDEPGRLKDSASSMRQQLESIITKKPPQHSGNADLNVLGSKLYEHWLSAFDTEYGGFGSAPKFPSTALTFYPLLRFSYYSKDPEVAEQAKKMCSFTLRRLMRGGIHDHVGQGVARYSVDRTWLCPHFEKMLYDQVQLMSAALESALLADSESEKQELQDVAVDLFQYLERDLQSPQGALYSAEDADSLPSKSDHEKKEGAFYVWTQKEIEDILGHDAPIFNAYFGVQENGNVPKEADVQGELTGKNILSVTTGVSELSKKYNRSEQDVETVVTKGLGKLKEYRDSNRPRPHLDDKLVTAWNGLALSALARLAEHPLKDRRNVNAAAEQMSRRIVKFLRENVWDGNELSRSWKEGKGPRGQCEDYAFLIQGLLDLNEALGEADYLKWAKQLQAAQDKLFWDEDEKAYFASPAGDPSILLRMKEFQDGAEPSSNSVSISNLFRLGELFFNEQETYFAKGHGLSNATNNAMLMHAPHGAGTALFNKWRGEGMRQFIVLGKRDDPKTAELLGTIRKRFMPDRIIINVDPDDIKSLGELATLNPVVSALVAEVADSKDAASRPSIRVCQGQQCSLPIYDVAELEDSL